ncbi:MAG: YggT family protein [Limnohabitans sp.]|nr:YggT family protein [Limnohabitans sp.]MDP4734744.1 YggT family protein [Limnohabitans sp.]MDP4770933.1 YggT family protein [Limnohabitans sp.]MDP4923098.1 YggT family protein [Limnohabitans sp.]
MLFQMMSLVLDVVAGLVAGTCLLRLWMQRQRISFHQPIGRFVFALTDWLVLPLRKGIPSWSAWDLSSLAGAWLVKLVQVVLLWLLSGGAVPWAMLPWLSLLSLAQLVVSALSALVLVYAVMSWISPGSPMYDLVTRLAEPLLRPFRRVVPLIGGIDLSALVLLLALQMMGMVLMGLQTGGLR